MFTMPDDANQMVTVGGITNRSHNWCSPCPDDANQVGAYDEYKLSAKWLFTDHA